jgi:predicted glycosyltransferase involved in capsule biosynthesis
LTDPGLGAIPTHYGADGISEEQIAVQCKGNLLDFSGGSSFFMIHKSVFHFFRNCEKFLGAGYEDLDFVFNICQPAGVKSVTIHAKAIHRFHPQSERYPEYAGFNKQLYNERRVRLKGFGRPL